MKKQPASAPVDAHVPVDVYEIDGQRYIKENDVARLVQEVADLKMEHLHEIAIEKAEAAKELETTLNVIETDHGRVISIRQLISDVRLPESIWRKVGDILIKHADEEDMKRAKGDLH